MPPRPHRSSRHQARVGVTRVVAALSACAVLAGCAVDPGVASMSAEPTPSASIVPPLVEPTASTDPTSTLDTSTADTGPLDTGPLDTANDPTTLPPPDTGPPPIVEPELSARIPIDQVVDVGSSKPPQDHDEFVAVALSDIERWWSEIYPD
ncbi:MAG: hypothetical protein ABIO83_05820, partial [Ilumatobacteraceae bacterium]